MKRRNDNGLILVLFALSVVVLLGIMALAIDTGYIFTAHAQLRNASDAAALAGASRLSVDDNSGARQLAKYYAEQNTAAGSPISVDESADVELGKLVESGGAWQFVQTETDPDTVRVTLSRTDGSAMGPLPLLFARVLGFDTVDLQSVAMATLPNKHVVFVLDRSGSMDDDTTYQWSQSFAPGWYTIAESSKGWYWLPSGDYWFEDTGWIYLSSGFRYLDPGDMYFPGGTAKLVDGEPQPIGYMKDAAQSFIDRLNSAEDKIGLSSYATTASLNHILSQDFDAVKASIEAMIASGWTNIGDGIHLANQELASPRAEGFGRKVQILLSDGCANRPNDPVYARQYALQRAGDAQSAGILIFTVSLGNNADRSLMQSIANMTGGAEYYAAQGQDLSTIFNEIFERIPPRLTF